MCDRESFARLRDQTEANTKQISELAKSDAVQSVQIANLAKTTERQGDVQLKLIKWLVVAIVGVLLISVLALVYGGLGERGFNGVTHAAPQMAVEVLK